MCGEAPVDVLGEALDRIPPPGISRSCPGSLARIPSLRSRGSGRHGDGLRRPGVREGSSTRFNAGSVAGDLDPTARGATAGRAAGSRESARSAHIPRALRFNRSQWLNAGAICGNFSGCLKKA